MPIASTFGRPGVYLEERPLPRNIPPQGTSAAVAVLVGYSTAGPMGPAYVESWRDFVSYFGGTQTETPLQRSAYQAFSHGSGPMHILRVVGAASTIAKLAPQDEQFFDYKFEAVSAGVWGDAVTVSVAGEVDKGTGSPTGLKTVEVSLRGGSYKETFTGLSDDPATTNYLMAVINDSDSGSRWINAAAVADTPAVAPLSLMTSVMADGTVHLEVTNPELDVASATLVGGYSEAPLASDFAAAFSRLDEVEGALLIYVTDASYLLGGKGAEVNLNAENYAKTRGDSFAILDTGRGLSVNEVLGYGVSASDYSALYYPQIRVANPAQNASVGSTIMVPPGAALTGLILASDRVDGTWKSPSGPSFALPTAASSRFLGVEYLLTNDELDRLNTGDNGAGSPVNALRPMINSGVTVMGSRTRTTDTIGRYITVRRTLNYLKVELQNRAVFALFEPITGDLMSEIQVSLAAFLTDIWLDGGLAGAAISDAFYVVCDDTNNTQETISNGFLYVDVGLALLIPAEYIVIRVGQYEGGTSTSEIDVTR